MAFGEHWEWRGFGTLPEGARRALESLPCRFPSSQEVADEYIHAPGCRVNIKLRQGSLKFKRLIEERGGLERWLEDEEENHPFPLAPGALRTLARDLGLRLDPALAGAAGAAADPEALIDLLRRADPQVRVLVVEKSRWQRLWSAGAGEPEVTVELAEIAAPEAITSVALEHPDPRPVALARDALGLESCLRRLNYMEALAIWTRGDRVAGGGRPPP